MHCVKMYVFIMSGNAHICLQAASETVTLADLKHCFSFVKARHKNNSTYFFSAPFPVWGRLIHTQLITHSRRQHHGFAQPSRCEGKLILVSYKCNVLRIVMKLRPKRLVILDCIIIDTCLQTQCSGL